MNFTTPDYRAKLLKTARLICCRGRDEVRKYYHLLMAAKQLKQGWAVDAFVPYKYQLQWFESGAHYRLRYLSAANRIGKTFSAAAEFSYHSTGEYPDWWKGYRAPAEYIGLDRIMWAVGVSAESTRKVLQVELLGTSDARRKDLYGTGSIPRERIDMTSFVCDGETVKSFRVWHTSGERTEVHFYSATQDMAVLMGQAIIFAWIDEQSLKEDELVAQCTTRTMTTGGQVVITATPEIGATDLYVRCKEDTTGEIYFQNATWRDAPHISAADIVRMLALTPFYQREMRSEGLPIMGVGAIYPFRESSITCAPFPIPSHWRVLAGLDFGLTGFSDPSIIVMVARDPETGKKYVFAEWSSEMDRPEYALSHMPDYLAAKIIGREPKDWQEATGGARFEGMDYPSIAVVAPGDGDGVQSGTQKTRSTIMRDTGANMCPAVWKLHESQLPDEVTRNSKVGSISLVAQEFQDGDLFIFNTCTEVLRELRLYQWVKEGKRTIPSPKNDHFMDAMRYAVTRVEFDGNYVYEAVRGVDYEEVYENNSPYKRAMGAYKL